MVMIYFAHTTFFTMGSVWMTYPCSEGISVGLQVYFLFCNQQLRL